MTPEDKALIYVLIALCIVSIPAAIDGTIQLVTRARKWWRKRHPPKNLRKFVWDGAKQTELSQWLDTKPAHFDGDNSYTQGVNEADASGYFAFTVADDSKYNPDRQAQQEQHARDVAARTAKWMHDSMRLGGVWAATSEWVMACAVQRAIEDGDFDLIVIDPKAYHEAREAKKVRA